MAEQTLLDRIKAIMYGASPQLMDLVTKTMYAYDSKTTSTGQTPNEVDLDPKIPDVSGLAEHVTFTFGRFSVPHAGHAKMIAKVIEEADGGDHMVFVSHAHDAIKNPLVFEDKVKYLKAASPNAHIYEDEKQVRTLFDAIKHLEELGFKSGTMVVGEDRVTAFSKLLEQYAHEYSMIIGVVAVSRSDDGYSATLMREAVKINDYVTFSQMTAVSGGKLVEDMYYAVAEGMNLTEIARIPTPGESAENNGVIGVDSDLGDKDDVQIRRRKTIKRFKQIVDET